MLKVMHSGARRSMVLSSLVRSGIFWWARARWGRWGKVQLGTVWRGLSLRGLASYGTVLSCQARLNKALFGEVFRGMVSSGEALLSVAGWLGALCSKVRSYCGMVRSVEVLHGIVKFCPQKHSVVGFAKALLRHGIVRRSTVRSGFARLRAVGQAPVSSSHGSVMWGGQRFGGAMHGDVWLGVSRLGMAMRGPVGLGLVKSGFAMRGTASLAFHGYGGYQK